MKTVRYGVFISMVLFLFSQLIFADNFPGSKTVVAYVQPNQGNTYYAYGTFGIDIGKKYVSEAQETETARTKFSFDLTSIPENATINSVDLNYTISNYENGSYHFKMTQIGNYNSPQEIYQNIEQAAVLFADVLYNSGSLNSGTLTSLVNSSKGSILYLGGLSQNESSLDSWANLDITLSISFSIPPAIVTITADNNFNAPGGGNHGIIEVDGDNHTAPWPFDKNVGQSTTLRALRQNDEQGYVRDWNNAYPNLQSKWEKILLGVTTNKGNSNPYNFIDAADDDGSTYKANLRILYQISRNDQTEFDDLIQEGVQAEIFDQNSGDITAPATLTPGSITYNFAGWTDDFTLPNTRTITPEDNETYTTLYKYPHHSNTTDAYKNNSQRKFIQTPDGVKHIVYESMGKVWYELSTDGGSSWFIGNGGKPLSSEDSKNPSMSYYGNQVGIVWQEKNGLSYKIKIAVFYGSNYSSSVFGTVANEVLDYSHNANPVIAFGYSIAGQGNLMVAWSGAVYGLFNAPGIMLNLGFATSNGISWTSQKSLPGTDANSINPTIAANYLEYSDPFNYHLAWEQVTSSTTSKINYCTLYFQNNVIKNSLFEEPSSKSGYSKNYSPIVELRKVSIWEYVYVTWLGYRNNQQEQLAKGNSVTTDETRVLMKYKNTNWSVLGVYGNDVNNFSLNKGTSVISNQQIMGLAWSETNGSSFTNKLMKSPGSGSIITLTTTGKDLQINNSVNFNDMYANSYQTQLVPYNFELSQNFGSFGKENSIGIFKGREGVVAKDSAQFYFAVGDITLNGENIDFVEIDDTVNITSRQMLNSYLISQPFTVNDNSTLTYGVQYGITDSSFAVAALSDGSAINFKVELIDDQTGEVLGSFDDVTYSPDNVFQYNNIGYDVDMTGIGSRTVRFKLIVNTDADCEYSLSKRYADEGILSKSGKKQVKYQGTLAVTDYSLEQNYPNPLNPSTTIKYQIPENGLVTLKVYDVLGREVATLVNSEQQAGRYEVNFNATNLASGVYLYRIKVNDYVAVKKMLLVK